MKNESGKIELNVKLTPEEVTSRISSIMDKETLFWHFTYTGDKKFIGKIKGQEFRVQKKIGYRNSWNHILFGRIKQMQNGSRIQGCLRMHSFVTIFMIFWFAGTSAFALLGGLILLTVPNPDSKNIVFIAVPLVMLVFGIGLVCIGTRIGKRDGNEAVTAFLDMFSDVLL